LKAEEARRDKEEVRRIIDELKQNTCCTDCGLYEPEILVFHHTVVCDKNKKLSECSNKYTLYKELKKGVLVCPNCHARRHKNKKTGKIDYANIEYR